MNLLPMDYALLGLLVENGGSCPSIAIPSRMFRGEIPEGAPNLVEAGVIVHVGDCVNITELGRCELSEQLKGKDDG